MAKEQKSEQNWLRDLLVLPLVVGVIVAAIVFGLPRFFREAKELSYVIDEPVAYLDDPAISHVKVEVNGIAVSNLVAYKVRLWNSGDVPLKKLPVSFVFQESPTGFQIFNISHLTTPSYEFGGISEETLVPSKTRFVYELLNPGDQDIVTILTNGKVDLELFAKVEKLKVKSIQPETQQRGWTVWLSISAVLVAVIASALTTFFKYVTATHITIKTVRKTVS